MYIIYHIVVFISRNHFFSLGAERNVATAGAAVLLGTALSMLLFA